MKGGDRVRLKQMPRFVVTIFSRMDFNWTHHRNLFIPEKSKPKKRYPHSFLRLKKENREIMKKIL